MELSIITPFRKLVSEEKVSEVFVPGFEGQLNVLEGHANFITELETGVIAWKGESGQWKRATVSYGWMEIYNQKITVLADVSELAEEVDVERAKNRETIARQKIQEGSLSDEDFRKMELKLKRAIARQSAVVH